MLIENNSRVTNLISLVFLPTVLTVLKLVSINILYAQEGVEVLQDENRIQISETKKTEFTEQSFETERLTPFLKQFSNQQEEINEQQFNYLPDNGFENTGASTFDFSDINTFLDLSYGLGNHFVGEVGLEYITNLSILKFDFYGNHRMESMTLDGQLSTIPNSTLSRFDFDFFYSADLGKHQLKVEERYLSLGLQEFNQQSYYRNYLFNILVSYQGKYTWEEVRMSMKQKAAGGQISFTPDLSNNGSFMSSNPEIFTGSKNNFFSYRTWFKFEPSYRDSDFWFGLQYDFDLSVTQDFYRHFGRVNIGKGLKFRDQLFFSFTASLMVLYQNKDSKLDYFFPYFVLPNLEIKKKWESVVFQYNVGIDAQSESLGDLYGKEVTISLDELGRFDRLAYNRFKFDFKLVEGLTWNVVAFFNFYLTQDQLLLNDLELKEIVGKEEEWDTGGSFELEFNRVDWVTVNSRLTYRYMKTPEMLPSMENHNRVEFKIDPINSVFSLEYSILWQKMSYLAKGRTALSLDRQLLNFHYSYRLSNGFDLKLDLKNLLNEKYNRYGSYFQGSGRNIYLGLGLTL